MPVLYHPELDIETYGLTIWDLDREFSSPTDSPIAKAQRCERFSTFCSALTAARSESSIVTFRARKRRQWIREQIRREFVEPEPIPVEVKKHLLWKLISAEQFERFLHTKYLGQKRFSLEGCETVIPLLDRLIDGAAARGVEDITLGMAHRGRLNVLANVIGNLCERIFAAFEGSVHPAFPADEGDVKYHQGATGERVLDDGTQSSPVAFAESEPSRSGRSGCRRNGAGKAGRNAGPARRNARAGYRSRAARAASRRCRLCRPGHRDGNAESRRFERLSHRRHDSHHHQQSDRIHYFAGSRTFDDLFN